jgi:hypothetical protein
MTAFISIVGYVEIYWLLLCGPYICLKNNVGFFLALYHFFLNNINS